MKRLSLGAKVGVGTGVAALGILAIGAFYALTTRAPLIPAPAPLPAPNGYDFYLAAARALHPAAPPGSAISDRSVPPPAQAALNYAPARRQKWLDANSPSWNLLARALKTSTRNTLPRGAEVDVSSDYGPLRELARGQTVRIRHFKAQKQWGAALTTGLDTLQMGRDIERGANLIGSLVGIAIEAIGESELQDLPSHLSAIEAKNGARRLEKLIAGATPFSAVLTEEKWSFATTLDKEWEQPNGRGAGFWGHLLLPKTRVLRNHNAMLDAFIAQADKPALAQIPVASPALWEYPNPILYPTLGRSFFNQQRRQTLENLLLLRLALRAYRLENGAYPAALSQLAPKYLAKIPTDSFGRGEAMRYRNLGDSYLAWSIGPDKIDGHGAPILNKLGKKPRFYVAESRGDVVVRP